MVITLNMLSVSPVLKVVSSSDQAPIDGRIVRLRDEWLDGFKSQETRRGYRDDHAAWLTFCAEHDIDPLTARRVDVNRWARALEAAGAKPRSVARRLAALASWYRYVVDEGVRPTSPLERVRRPKVNNDRGVTPGLNREELRRLLAAAGEHESARTVALLTLFAHTGLRINEALSRDVEHLGHDRGHRILRLERKGDVEDRTVLTAPVARAIDAYLAGWDSGAIFITRQGGGWTSPEAWRTIRRIARRAELDGAREIRPHSLRVAFITGAREAGIPLEDVQDAAGHADPRTTRRYDRGRHSLDRHASYAVTTRLAGGPDDEAGRWATGMTDTMRVRSSDFFVVDEDATVEINGGSPFVYVLNEGLLEDLRRETLPLTPDSSAAEGLLDLVESELVAQPHRQSAAYRALGRTACVRVLCELVPSGRSSRNHRLSRCGAAGNHHTCRQTVHAARCELAADLIERPALSMPGWTRPART
jgi:integrase/recombinase XerD